MGNVTVRTGRASAAVGLLAAGLLTACGSAVPSASPPSRSPSMNALPGTRPSTTPSTTPSSPATDEPSDIADSAVASARAAVAGSFGMVDAHTPAFVRIDRAAHATSGTVSVGVPGTGLVWTSGRASLAESGSRVTIRYDGRGRVAAHVDIDPVVQGLFSPLGTPSVAAPLRVSGTVDTATATGTVDLWVDGVHHRVTAVPAPHDADLLARRIVTATRHSDWATIYRLSSTDLRLHFSEAAFVAKAARAFSGGGRILAVRITGPAAYRTTQTGVSFAVVPMFTSAVLHGHTDSGTSHLELVRESGAWRWWTSK